MLYYNYWLHHTFYSDTFGLFTGVTSLEPKHGTQLNIREYQPDNQVELELVAEEVEIPTAKIVESEVASKTRDRISLCKITLRWTWVQVQTKCTDKWTEVTTSMVLSISEIVHYLILKSLINQFFTTLIYNIFNYYSR